MNVDPRRLVIFAVVSGVVVAASLVPAPAATEQSRTDIGVRGADTVLHLVGYAAVAYTLARATDPSAADPANDTEGVRHTPVVLVGVVAVAAAIGGGVELAQGMVPGRDPAALDAVANAVGAVVGVVWWRLGDSLWWRLGTGQE